MRLEECEARAIARGPLRAGGTFRPPWPLSPVVLLAALAGFGAGAPAQQPTAKAAYARLCAACHGPTGAGDGPAAVALKPRPASFADSTFQAARTDSQLAAAITSGKAPMPGFGGQLRPAEVRALVAYVRSLGLPATKP